MKKKIRVIRKANQTIVIYSEPLTEKSVPVMKQKPVPVYSLGKLAHFIMPSGKIYPVRRGRMWRILKLFRPSLAFVAV